MHANLTVKLILSAPHCRMVPMRGSGILHHECFLTARQHQSSKASWRSGYTHSADAHFGSQTQHMWLTPCQLLPLSIPNLVSPYRRRCGSLSSKPRNGNSNFLCSVYGQGHRCSDLDPAEASVCPQPASSISHSSPGPKLVPTAMPAVTPSRAMHHCLLLC